ncbi:MAG: GNAT family N-acetyltransferase [Pseudomonadota bacterium]
MTAPTILTARLKLTAPQPSDYDAFAQMWADRDVVRFIGGEPRNPQDAWLTLMRNAGAWALLGFGPWIIRDRKTDEFIGDAGFCDYRRGMSPDISGYPEAGWVFAKPHWGKGYATEALTATHAWLDEVHPGRSVCIIEPDHAASIRVAQKVGYRDFVSSDYKGTPMLIFERFTSGTGKS